jgi:hypothetical protein
MTTTSTASSSPSAISVTSPQNPNSNQSATGPSHPTTTTNTTQTHGSCSYLPPSASGYGGDSSEAISGNTGASGSASGTGSGAATATLTIETEDAVHGPRGLKPSDLKTLQAYGVPLARSQTFLKVRLS